MLLNLLLLLVGLLMLVSGAELLVRGGGQIALLLRVPALVVGLTIVAFGTSAPELATSLRAATSGGALIALSNVTGSNIANVALVLGAAALTRPLVVDRTLIRRDVPSLLVLQTMVIALAWDGTLSRVDGMLLIAGGVAYNGWLFYEVFRGRAPAPDDELEEGTGGFVQNGLMLLLGLAVLLAGAELFVNNARSVATSVGLSDRIVGLYIVALGTSAPELATAVVSAYRGEVELAVGNSLGSNILNIAMVLGITLCIAPCTIDDPGAFNDLFVALFGCVMLIPIVLNGAMGRVAGGVMIAAYLGYLGMGILAG